MVLEDCISYLNDRLGINFEKERDCYIVDKDIYRKYK